MFKKATILGALLTTLAMPSYNAEAGVVSWVTGQDKDWTFGHVYESITGKNKEELVRIQAIQEQESKTIETQLVSIPPQTNKTIIKEFLVVATAYSSTVDQTDNTPFITASGTYVRDGVAAANFLPFGTTFKIPEIYGDKIFVIEDRMHKRFWRRVDIWFPERQMAKEFGIKQIRIEIIS